jgi:prophage antirepressor-like protein
MNEIIPFDFKGTPVRVVMLDETPWFVAADVCRVLGLKHVASSLRKLRPVEKAVHPLHGFDPSRPGHTQNVNLVTEPGYWRLIFRSDLPAAEQLQDFTYTEILPSIRKHGFYGSPDAMREIARQVFSEMSSAEYKLIRGEVSSLDLWTLADWSKQKAVRLIPKQSRAIGGALAAKCRMHQLRMGWSPSHHMHGRPNRTFPKSLLDRYFGELVMRHVPTRQLSLVAAGQAS